MEDHEYGQLLGENEKQPPKAKGHIKALGFAVGILAFGAVVSFSSKGLAGEGIEVVTQTSFDFVSNTVMDDTDAASITFSNEYGGQVSSIRDGFYSYSKVVEPYRVTTLTVVNADCPGTWIYTVTSKHANFTKFESYLLPNHESDVTINFVSNENETTYNFTKAGRWHDIIATCSSDSTAVVVETAICKYVRRELRTLNQVDQDNFLEAIEIMYHTRMEEGRAKYGDNFYGVEWYTRWHLGSPTANSPWHASPVFFTSHAIFGSHFERSLQSIYPALSAHYWDFTIDAALSTDWSGSFFWSEGWFGPHSSIDVADMHKATTGRWANIVIGRNMSTFNTHNSYGLVNEPYNNNPSNVLTRSFSICGMPTTAMSLPSCKELMGTFEQTTMTDFHSSTEYDLHVELHPLFGGAWDCEASLDETPDSLLNTMSYFVRDLTNYYIMNYYDDALTCPSYCSLDTDFHDCRCECDDLSGMLEESETLSNDQWYQVFEKVVANKTATATMPLQTAKILSQNKEGKWKFEGLSNKENAMMYESTSMLVCYPGRIGQFMGPLDSANDPIFFPTHINWERNWNYMRLKNNFNNTWNSGDTWSMVKGWAYTDPVAPFTNAYGNIRKKGYFTNDELIDLFDPSLDMLPFIWDDMSWKHCNL